MTRSLNPRVVVCGNEPELRHFNAVYRLQPHGEITFASRASGSWNTDIGGNVVQDLDSLNFDGDTAVICLEFMRDWLSTDEQNYGEFIKALERRGVKRERMFFSHQPGSIHRILSQIFRFDGAETMRLGHEAIFHSLFQRPNYAYGVMLAAEQARRLDLARVSIVETGVWFGAGLRNLCEICDFLDQTRGVAFDVYGFDSGAGLPALKDWRDHPELWTAGSMVMPDIEVLKRSLPAFCELIIGDVADTIPRFAAQTLTTNSPLGFISLDVDLYSASVQVLKLLESDARMYLPVVPVWVDDSNINILHSSFSGEALAISEFNQEHTLRKIDYKVIRTNHPPARWHHCFYFAHIFDHPYRNGERPGALADIFHVSY